MSNFFLKYKKSNIPFGIRVELNNGLPFFVYPDDPPSKIQAVYSNIKEAFYYLNMFIEEITIIIPPGYKEEFHLKPFTVKRRLKIRDMKTLEKEIDTITENLLVNSVGRHHEIL